MKCVFKKTGSVGFGDIPVCLCARSGCTNFGFAHNPSSLKAECKHPSVLPGTLLARLIKFATLGRVRECEACRRRERWLNEHLEFPLPNWLVRLRK